MEIVIFFHDDLCHPEPNHNWPWFVSVEHHNKLVWCTLIDQASSINILPTHVLVKVGYIRENLMPIDATVKSVSPTPCESLGTVSLYILVSLLSMPHIFHIFKVDPKWHMLLRRPCIYEHRCVPSLWDECIKVALSKEG